MNNLQHFKNLLEAEDFDYENLDKLTVTGKDGTTKVHKVSSDGKTVKEVESEKNDDTEKPKKKIEQYKSKDNSKDKSKEDVEDSKDTEIKED